MVYWRLLGKGRFVKTPLTHVNRGVYAATLPAAKHEGSIEYYVRVTGADDAEVRYPASAPRLNLTAVVEPGQ
jgi:hypothetical protein